MGKLEYQKIDEKKSHIGTNLSTCVWSNVETSRAKEIKARGVNFSKIHPRSNKKLGWLIVGNYFCLKLSSVSVWLWEIIYGTWEGAVPKCRHEPLEGGNCKQFFSFLHRRGLWNGKRKLKHPRECFLVPNCLIKKRFLGNGNKSLWWFFRRLIKTSNVRWTRRCARVVACAMRKSRT